MEIKPNSRDITIGEITLMAIGDDLFTVPGGGLIKGRANAIRAAKNLVNSNRVLRVRRR